MLVRATIFEGGEFSFLFLFAFPFFVWAGCSRFPPLGTGAARLGKLVISGGISGALVLVWWVT